MRQPENPQEALGSVHPAARLGVVAASGFQREAGKVALPRKPFCISSEGAEGEYRRVGLEEQVGPAGSGWRR